MGRLTPQQPRQKSMGQRTEAKPQRLTRQFDIQAAHSHFTEEDSLKLRRPLYNGTYQVAYP